MRRSLTMAERLDLDLSRLVAFMSTGMRQKLALALTLASNTPLLILDEPTSNLDPTVRAEVITLVQEARLAGRTVIFSSHVLSEVEEACDRVAILRAGRLVHLQVLAELHRRHRLRAVLRGALPPIPEGLREQTVVRHAEQGGIEIEAENLPPLLGWLGTVPLEEVRVEPIGLKAVYERFHNRREIAE
jgi:ABC-2 type transport system ATP-binding protein